jgi:glycosyltransferase involved in cell wall biosynthesis
MGWRLLSHEFAEEDFGFNFIGYVTGCLGLGVAGRNSLRALDRRGVRMCVTDYPLGDDRSDHDSSCRGLGEQREEIDPFSVNVFHVNPPEAKAAFTWGTIDLVDRFNVCVPFWELTVLPPEWVRVLTAMDVVLAPTEFVRNVVQSALPDALCLPYPQAVILPDAIAPDRDRWGLPADAVVFVSSFEVGSDTNRKNPWAVLDAFAAAFPDPGSEYLVMKVSAPKWSREAFPKELERLHARASESERVILLDEVMRFEDVLTLYASADVLVSLHRSEGLGLSLMEAMTLGKPVIATAYSGSMDYTTSDNSCLVGYDLIPVVSSHNSYSPDYVGGAPVWADPDITQAAEYMRALACDLEYRLTLGHRAAEDMARRRESYLSCGVWDEIRGLVFDHDSELWKRHRERIAHLTLV